MGTLATSIAAVFARMNLMTLADVQSTVPQHRSPTRRVSGLKPGQGRKYSGADLRELRAERGVGSVRRIRNVPLAAGSAT